MTCETERSIIIIVENCLEQMESEQYEGARDAQLRAEQIRLREMQALLWQMDNLIKHLDAQERVFIQRRYADGERVEDFYKELGVSRATAFRKIEDAISQLAELYNERYEMAA